MEDKNVKSYGVKIALLRSFPMPMRWVLLALLSLTPLALAPLCLAEAGQGEQKTVGERPRLVVVVMVDQLRGDLPLRYAKDFGDGGFRYLMEEGSWFTAADHPHSHTETVVGHTTVSTGTYPAAHGMIGNSWYERPTPPDGAKRTGKVEKPKKKVAMGAYSTGHGMMEPGWLARMKATVESKSDDASRTDGGTQQSTGDGEYKIIGTSTAGADPTEILTTTIGDELKITTAEGAKVFSVSIKDRAAVALAGHTGKAFWFNSNTGKFVTSTYYFDAYPSWVTAWNDAKHADTYSGQSWTLELPRADYLYGDQDDRPWEPSLMGYGNVFPHPFGEIGNPMQSAIFYTKLTISPVGDELILSFVRDLIENEGLGTDDIPDYLGISLSSNDIIGHWYGPSSLESEVSIRTLDQNLAKLFGYLEDTVGMENTVVVLAGDHGIPEVPEYLETLKVPTGRISEEDIEAKGVAALTAKYPAGDRMVLSYDHPYFYLDRALIKAQGLEEAEVERYLAERMTQEESMLFAVPCTDLRRGGEEVYPEMIARIRRNQNPDRSGDVYVVQASQWQVGEQPASDEPVVIVNHGSPWAYDTYVPVAFAGKGIPAKIVNRRVSTVDIAPTLALLWGAKPPSAAIGSPLIEVLDGPELETVEP